MPRILAAILFVVVFFAGASLAYFNFDYVSFNYLFGAAQVRLVVLILFTFVTAALLTLGLCAVRLFTLSGETRRLRRQLRDAETELKNLRNLTIAPDR